MDINHLLNREAARVFGIMEQRLHQSLLDDPPKPCKRQRMKWVTIPIQSIPPSGILDQITFLKHVLKMVPKKFRGTAQFEMDDGIPSLSYSRIETKREAAKRYQWELDINLEAKNRR